MTIRTSEVAHPSTDLPLRYLFSFLDFMRTASPGGPGWSIVRSSDGATGGAGDNIAAFADLSQFTAGVAESWFVLRAPDGSKEILFYRTSSNDTLWSIAISPGAMYVGGDAGNQATAADEYLVLVGATLTSTGVSFAHYLADDTAPFGFATYMHLSGAPASARASMAYVPITAAIQAGEVDPYLFWIGLSTVGYGLTSLDSETENTSSSHFVGLVPGSTVNTIPALRLESRFGDCFPNAAPQDNNGDDLSAPIMFGRRSGISGVVGFKGLSDFIQWNGVVRAPIETFTAQTRISFGNVNFPWDGSVPGVS